MQSSVARIVLGTATAAVLAGSAACAETAVIPVSDTSVPQTSRVPFPVPSWMITTSDVPVQQPQTGTPAPTTTVRRVTTTTRPRPRTTTRTVPRTTAPPPTTTTNPPPPPPPTTATTTT